MNEQPPPSPAPAPVKKAPEEKPINLPADAGLPLLLEALLKSPRSLGKHLEEGGRSATLFLIAMVASTLLFGLLLGTFSGGTQLWAAPVKVSLGILFSSIICFPSLYIFAALDGSTSSVMGSLRKLIAVTSLVGLLLISFAPVVWIFAQSTDEITVVGSIVITIWIIAVLFGVRLLKRLIVDTDTPKAHLSIWGFIFLLVTLQMSTALRPIIGTSETLLPTEKRFFLEHWSYGGEEESDDLGRDPYKN